MEIYSEGNKCCSTECNIVETDGTHVCIQCGKVQDLLCFNNYIGSHYVKPLHSFLLEVCHRLEIDDTTKNDANEIYNEAVANYPSLRKNILISASIYIAAKKNLVPRTLKEISLATGTNVKKLVITKELYVGIISPLIVQSIYSDLEQN